MDDEQPRGLRAVEREARDLDETIDESGDSGCP